MYWCIFYLLPWASLVSICTGVSSTRCHGLVWLVYVSVYLLHGGMASMVCICTGISSTWCHGLVWLVYVLVYLLHGVMG